MLTLVPSCRIAYQSLALLSFTRSDRVWFRVSVDHDVYDKERREFNSRSLRRLSFLFAYFYPPHLPSSFRFFLSLLYLTFYLLFRCNVITFSPICVIDSKYNLSPRNAFPSILFMGIFTKRSFRRNLVSCPIAGFSAVSRRSGGTLAFYRKQSVLFLFTRQLIFHTSKLKCCAVRNF